MSENLYQRIFAQLLTGIAVTTLEGRILECNNALTKITGYGAEELAAMSLADLYVNPSQQVEDMRELHKEGLVRNLEIRIKTKRGEERTLLVSASFMRGDNRPIVGSPRDGHSVSPRVLSSITDITARSWEWDEITRRNRELAIWARIGQALNSFLDLKDLLQILLDEAVRSTGAERGCLMLGDAETGQLNCATATNMESSQSTATANPPGELSYTIIRNVLESGKPVLTVNAKEDPQFSGIASVVGYSLRSILCVPLRRAERTLGVLYVDNRLRTGEFSLEDLGLLKIVANQAVTVIENVRLYEAEKARSAQLAAQVEQQSQRLRELTDQLNAKSAGEERGDVR